MEQTFRRYGSLKRSVSPFFSILILLFSLLPVGADPASQTGIFLEDFLKRADELNLHEDSYWWTLLHYKRGLFGVRSLVDDPRFFISPDGKHDPKAELKATLTAFFQTDRKKADQAACRFIARYAWLKVKLAFHESGVSEPECERFQEIFKKIDPQAATLIFPTSSMNSPASMFGHTLIRFESSYKSKLLTYAVNYAAVTTETNGILFAFKGIFGFYEGYFSVLPYYKKVEEYSDINQRDIWEYQLNLTQEETIRMFMHLWELENIYSFYYFFDENCSYTLLFLLDAARPSLHLTDRPGLWVMPIDTIRALKKKGAIQSSAFRPSRATKIKHLMSLLDPKGLNLAMDVIKENMDPGVVLREKGSEENKRIILDLVMECIQYQYATDKLSRDLYIQRFLRASEARSRLGKAEPDEYAIPAPARPEKGHKPNRLSLGFGVEGWNRPGDHSLFQEIRFRPTYHDFMDADDGYVKGSQIEFFNTVLRYYFSGERVELQKLDLISIESVSKRDRFFKPISWKIKTGLNRERLPKAHGGLVYQLAAGGGGFSYENKHLGLYSFMMEAEIDVGDGLKDSYAVGAGCSMGLIKSMSDFWKLHLFFRPLYFFLGEEHLLFEWEVAQQYRLTTNTSISLGVSGRKISDFHEVESKFTFHLYF